MHNSLDREQLDTGPRPGSAVRGSEVHCQRRLKRKHYLMSNQDEDGLAMLTSLRSEQQQLLCKYKSGKCSNARATKRNGKLHTLCHFHRDRQNEHQRKSDRKQRLVSVTRRSKLGSIDVAGDSARQQDLHLVTSIKASFPRGSSISPLKHHDQNASHLYIAQNTADGTISGTGRLPSPAAGTTRLPPISFLMRRKLDGHRVTSNIIPIVPPSNFIIDSFSGNAGKTA
ncbi:hypothetical protein CCR75_002772 [Bremia lactucae]|uniref:Uncharacterized protein n=1 Tax=Bremia lactucae TaxID=4779 RepID=A0A976IFM7_BRELC|nr:hypothetical protein CCR75_002772 [Bremia lactucae]